MPKCCCGFIAFIGLIFVIYHLVKVIISSSKEGKMRKVKTTPLSELLRIKDELAKKPKYLEIKGISECESPVLTPFTGIETSFFDFKITQYWTLPSGENDIDKKKVVHNSRGTCKFHLVQGSTKVPVLLDVSLNTDFDAEAEKEFKRVQHVKDTPITYVSMPQVATDISYEYTENYLPLGKSIYFIGNVHYQDGNFVLKPGGTLSFISDKSEKKILLKARKQKAISIRWLFAASIVFALGFIGFYGKPEGLADVLRGIIEFILEVLSEMD